MAYARRDFVGSAAATTLSSPITSGDSSISITSGSGWPTAANGNFYVVIDRDTATEEKILCSGRTSNVLAVDTRGVDGTSAASHPAGATIEHCITAVDLDEANYTVAETVGKVTTAGDLLVADGANSFARLAKGSNGNVLLMSAGSVGWGGLPSNSVDSSQIVDNAVSKAKVAAAARYHEVQFSKQGTLTTGQGTFRWYAITAVTVVDAWASVGTAPTGQALIVDVHHNGTTIFTTQSGRPQISAAANYDASGTPDGDVTLDAGDYLTVDIDQVGSGTAGSDLVVGIRYYET